VIPRIIHQIWVGPDPLPREFEPYVKSWKRHHPDWEHRLWTEDNLPEDPIRPEVRERLRAPTERSDILRLELLYRYGGVYADTDLECRRPVDELLGDEPFVGTFFKPDRVTNTFLASVPNHPLLERALREIRPREFHGFDKDVAGPPFLARLLRDFPDVKLLEPRHFFPASQAEQERATGVHHRARAWKDAEGLRLAMVLAEERLEKAEERLEKAQAELEKERRRHDSTRERLAKLKSSRAGKRGLRHILRRSS
jgi:inositol phosphorylceramide mannosyltransferase catalytic subunit